MVTASQAVKKYGDPELLATQNKHFQLWHVPMDIQDAFKHVRFSALGTIGFPKRIFLNNDMRHPLEKALRNLMERKLTQELKTWDGVFIIRTKRGLTSMSLHSWAIAVDVNAATNRLGAKPTLTNAFVRAWRDAGFDWGGTWSRPDGMHFQVSKI